MRRAILVGATLVFLQLSSASAHDFPAPSVTVTISNLTPNGHPNVRTEIDVPTGAGFDMLRIDSPDGTTIASDADIADGTVVGRLDGDATTNAITLPVCDVHTSFSVAIQEATTDRNSANYPAYLNDLAPGQHQLRLVADVSPSPDIPILINYLFDVEAPSGPIINDPSVGHVVSRVIVGNPLDPPEQFRSCSPTRSVNTIFGVTPDGIPLLTAGPTPFDEPLRFTFDFTSRPDELGERHIQRVETTAQTLSPPDDASEAIHPAPTDLRVTRNSARVLVLSWEYDVRDGAFQVDVIRASKGMRSSLTSYASLSAEIPSELLPACPSDEQVTLQVMRISVAAADVAELTVNPCSIEFAADTISAPSVGDGASTISRRSNHVVALVIAGMTALVAGVRLRGSAGTRMTAIVVSEVSFKEIAAVRDRAMDSYMKLFAGAIALLITGVLVAGCGESKDENTPTAIVTSTPVAEDTRPEHLTFAPGETISADGKAGIFFLDPRTGAAEAWVVPGNDAPDAGGHLPFSFTVGGISADGSGVLYTCRESGTSGLNPCGDETHEVWYLLNTRTGSSTRLEAFTGDFLSISADGKQLLGRTSAGIALADTARPADTRPVDLPAPPSADLGYARADWSPDGTRVVLAAGGQISSMFLVDVGSADVIELSAASGGVQWSPDGARFTLGRQVDELHSELVVLDRDAAEIWSKPIAAGGVAAIWSGDGTFLYAEEQEQPGTADGFGPLNRVIVLDANTGATVYRIRGAFCAIGWAGKSHTLLTSSYGFGQPVADLDAGTLTLIEKYVMPTPLDEDLAIAFDGGDFYSYDLSSGATELIARTTVSPAWDPVHEPLFAGERLVFTSLHGGHGGCGEGNGPQNPPQPELLAGPFADDAPVTLSGAE